MNILKIILLFLLFQIDHVSLFAQKIIDSIRVCEYPVREGIIYLIEQGTALRCGEPGVAILTNSDSVFCEGNGLIIGIHSYNDGCAITIRTEKDDYVSYSNLKTSGLGRGDVVQKGTFLGLAGISDDARCRQINVMILDKKAKYTFLLKNYSNEYVVTLFVKSLKAISCRLLLQSPALY
jgi:hypothetical protein